MTDAGCRQMGPGMAARGHVAGEKWDQVGSASLRRSFVIRGLSGICLRVRFIFAISLGPHAEKTTERTVELPVQARFVAVQGFEIAAVVAQLAYREHGADGRGFGYIGLRLSALLMVDGGGFDGPAAPHAPSGDGHGVDEIMLDECCGLEFRFQILQELVKERPGFAIDENYFGEETVAFDLTGGVELALRGFCAVRFERVGAIGSEPFFGDDHTATVCRRVFGLGGYVVGFIG
jgi:hypothetical protein